MPCHDLVLFEGFGIVVWEMATLRKPMEGYSDEDFMNSVVRGGERPAINRKWPKGFATLIESCWQADPTKRPVSEMNDCYPTDWRIAVAM